MGVWACGQAKLLDQIFTHQIIAATSINDDACLSIVDNEENLEQIVALQLLSCCTCMLSTRCTMMFM
jgi:hypothetical protein